MECAIQSLKWCGPKAEYSIEPYRTMEHGAFGEQPWLPAPYLIAHGWISFVGLLPGGGSPLPMVGASLARQCPVLMPRTWYRGPGEPWRSVSRGGDVGHAKRSRIRGLLGERGM